MSHTRNAYREWTKEDMKFVISNWDNMSIPEMAEVLKVESNKVNAFAGALRRHGIKLTKKCRNGNFQMHLNKALEELNIK
jgi:hypothetical protein